MNHIKDLKPQLAGVLALACLLLTGTGCTVVNPEGASFGEWRKGNFGTVEERKAYYDHHWDGGEDNELTRAHQRQLANQ